MPKLDGYSALLHFVLAGLALAVLLLVRENRDLRARVEPPMPEQLEVGDLLEPLAIVDLEGRESKLDFRTSGEQNVLMVFTTRCPYCLENQGAWDEVYQRFKDRYRVLGIAVGDLEAVQSYAETHALRYPVVIPADSMNFASAYKVPSVPTTLLVGPDGRVRQVWKGQLAEDSYALLEAG